jgi:hypothetical protein
MNGRDVEDVLQLLAEQRAALNHSIETYQRKLLFRLRTQIVGRAPVSAEAKGPVEEFVAFARWLEAARTLEHTYLGEGEGGQPWFRSLQMTADAVRDLQSQQLRRTLYDHGLDENYLEQWTYWSLEGLEAQLNRWRHLPAAALPLRIEVHAAPLAVPAEYRELVRKHGDTTLLFRVVEA